MENNEIKQCSKCGQIKDITEFYDSSLSSSYGRICMSCKQNKSSKPKIKAKREALPCPKCNAPMTIKKSVYGQFYSCSRYPTCNGKRSIKS
ncbi:hypothetical protein BK143_11580 [Paenibacillus peoriae]|uniref:topoisomerase DNA-binding C4 zinc finger domain-containing protein n=1 Tax=Paenibacillus peoriae TaxID=59893 RepID=UPI00096F39E9|nr:hypothetical protein BK143_11580 [Paenibacillus peoriae]